MKVSPLFNEEAAQEGANLVVEITHKDLTETTAATAQTIQAFNVAATKQSVQLVRVELVEPFEDTTDTGNNTTAVEIGDGGDTDRLCAATELNRNGTEVYLKAGTGTVQVFSSADTVDFLFAAAAATKNHAALNRGKLRAFFILRDSRD